MWEYWCSVATGRRGVAKIGLRRYLVVVQPILLSKINLRLHVGAAGCEKTRLSGFEWLGQL